MKIEPIFTLQIEGETYINAETGVLIFTKRRVDNYATQGFAGLFKSCDEEGLYLEVGEEESNIIYIAFDEIVDIKEL